MVPRHESASLVGQAWWRARTGRSPQGGCSVLLLDGLVHQSLGWACPRGASSRCSRGRVERRMRELIAWKSSCARVEDEWIVWKLSAVDLRGQPMQQSSVSTGARDRIRKARLFFLGTHLEWPALLVWAVPAAEQGVAGRQGHVTGRTTLQWPASDTAWSRSARGHGARERRGI